MDQSTAEPHFTKYTMNADLYFFLFPVEFIIVVQFDFFAVWSNADVVFILYKTLAEALTMNRQCGFDFLQDKC